MIRSLTSNNQVAKQVAPVPHALVLTLCWLFAILYGVWLLPDTVFVRHFCMVTGAILSLYVIYPRRWLLLKREALPIWLISLLFVWVTIHLFFIGYDFAWQLEEYTRIWKKAAVGTIFAIGLGFALASQMSDPKRTQQYWRVIYLGLLLPMVIYFIKLLATSYLPQFGLAVPKYLILSPDHIGNFLGISKSLYVFYLLPAFAIAQRAIAQAIKNNQWQLRRIFIYASTIPLTMLAFYIEGDRLGTAFVLLLILFSTAILFAPLIKRKALSWMQIFILLFVVAASVWIAIKAIQTNPQWKAVFADAKLAIQVDRYDNWKYNRNTHPGYPINELGIQATDSNYMRPAWSIIGVRLLAENPLGYGITSLSFGELSRRKWPDAETSWSHSAWLDFALGYGLPGLLLLALPAILVWKASKKLLFPWQTLGRWAIPVAGAVMLVKEISTEVVLCTLIFLIAWVCALCLANLPNRLQKPL